MKATYIKYSIFEIKNSFKRFITLAILAFLGIGFFVGIKALGQDINNTVDTYLEKQNMYDLKIVSNLGLENEDVEAIKKLDNIKGVYGSCTADAYITNSDNVTYPFTVNSIIEGINEVALIQGRMPQNIDECVTEENYMNQNNVKIGDYVEIEMPNKNIDVKTKKVKIVGVVKSPLYISRERGFSNIGNGKIKYFLYIPIENFQHDFFTEIYVKLDNPENINILNEKYNIILNEGIKNINEITPERTKARKISILKKYIEDKKEERKQNPLDTENEDYFEKTIREETKDRLGVELTKEELSEIAGMEKCNWTISKVWDNLGVVSLKRDSQSIEKLALVFPVIFFALAILITSITMHRMVEEQRNSLGILKYIGYDTNLIILKYIIYVTLAIIFGGAIGCIVGNILIPNVVWKAYTLMYSIKSNIITKFSYSNMVIGFLCMILSSYIATIYTVKKYMEVPTAELLRNKEEKIGKKISFESTKKWKKLNFKHQILIKNIVRYKKRFLITIIGVAGSISLVIAGFGIHDAISQILEYQMRKVNNYDIEINVNSNLTGYYLQKECQEIQNMEHIESCTQASMQSGTIYSKNQKEDIQIVIPKNNEEFSEYMTLMTTDNKIYTLQDDSIAVTQKVAEMLKIKVGDTVEISKQNDKNEKVGKFKVGAIVKNYIAHYIYIPKRTFVKELGSYTLNTIYAKREKNLTEQEKEKINKQILERENVKYILDTDHLEKLIDDQISSLNYAVIVLIISSGLLNFAVQYNLYNITLSERKKELMTLKVLGYSYKQIYKYMNFENFIATIIGIILGLGTGTIISKFIVKLCEPNYFKFVNNIKFLNYIYSTIITIIFSIIISISIYFAMKRINYLKETKNYD